LEPLRQGSFNKCQGTTFSKGKNSAKLLQKVKDATAISKVQDATGIWKSEKSPQPFRKVKNEANCHRSSTIGTGLSECQKREDMSLICAMSLNITETDDKR
jgi:hypothetical protein